MKPVARRQAAVHLQDAYSVSERRATQVVRMYRSTFRYRARPDRCPEVRERVRQLARECPRYGYRLLTDRIRYEGTEVNPKRIYRLYCEEGLQLPRRRRKKLRSLKRQPLPAADGVNSRWSMDFVHDMLADSRRFRALNVLDDCSRESLAIEVATSIPGKRVTRVLDHVAAQRGYPDAIVMDNGPEFTGRALDRWAAEHGVQLHFIDPGKPTQNAFVESFNDKFRSECLNTNWFIDLEDARARIEKWRREYNELRPHSSIGRIPPAEFTRRAAALRGPAAPFGLLLDPPGTEGKREHFVAQSLDQ